MSHEDVMRLLREKAELTARLSAAGELNGKQYDELVERDKRLKRAEAVVEAAKKHWCESQAELQAAIRRYEEGK